MPCNPVEAFLTTRAQIMSSYLQVVEGTARAIDMSYIFGTVVAPGPIASIPYFYAASLGSTLAESTSMVQLVPSRYSGPTAAPLERSKLTGTRSFYLQTR